MDRGQKVELDGRQELEVDGGQGLDRGQGREVNGRQEVEGDGEQDVEFWPVSIYDRPSQGPGFVS